MARRRSTSSVDALLDLIAMLPWWAGVLLAAVLYFVLHQIAAQPLPTAVRPNQIGAVATQSIWKGLATAGQYILPLICLAGAGISAWRRRERRALVTNVAQSRAADVLDGMSWGEFEMLVGEAFRLQGYDVAETGGGGADGGVDLVLRKGGEKFLVQCKQWRAYKVGVDVVRELFGVMAAKGATGGFVVTSGRFTDEAARFASGRNVTLVDGPALHGLIKRAKAAGGSRTATTAAPPAVADAGRGSGPSCPTCGKGMVRRTAKRGANAGQQFWGCSAYPACKGTRPIG